MKVEQDEHLRRALRYFGGDRAERKDVITIARMWWSFPRQADARKEFRAMCSKSAEKYYALAGSGVAGLNEAVEAASECAGAWEGLRRWVHRELTTSNRDVPVCAQLAIVSRPPRTIIDAQLKALADAIIDITSFGFAGGYYGNGTKEDSCIVELIADATGMDDEDVYRSIRRRKS